MARAALAFPAPPCRKRRFATRAAAQAALRELLKDWRRTLRYLLTHPGAAPRVYICPRCPGRVYHLTGEPDNGRSQRRGEGS